VRSQGRAHSSGAVLKVQHAHSQKLAGVGVPGDYGHLAIIKRQEQDVHGGIVLLPAVPQHLSDTSTLKPYPLYGLNVARELNGNQQLQTFHATAMVLCNDVVHIKARGARDNQVGMW